MEPIKCNICRKTKQSADFVKNGKTLKSCLDCRDKRKPVTTPESKPEKPVAKVVAKPEPKPETKPLTKLDWVFLSNKWIKQGKELELHQSNMKKLNLQYLKKCAFPVHQYLSRHWMVDIRDRYVG